MTPLKLFFSFLKNSAMGLGFMGLGLLTFSVGAAAAPPKGIYFGADLSYVNQMEDCGAVYLQNNQKIDPFVLLRERGANMVRVRLFHTPNWTRYSTLDDVIKTLTRARAQGLQTLLDFHYSDTWADPGQQLVPAAWQGLDDHKIAQALGDYTRDVLTQLAAKNLLPDVVQVGNETNREILHGKGATGHPINWARNARIFNTGIAAVRAVSVQHKKPIRVMLHIAQPENVAGWIDPAMAAGIQDFDMIGVSYYPDHSAFKRMNLLGQVFGEIVQKYPSKEVVVVEIGYPWTHEHYRANSHGMKEAAQIKGYDATPEGQKKFLVDFTQTLLTAGGKGVLYWEPMWVSVDCKSGSFSSLWENANWFDYDDKVLPAIDFMRHEYVFPK